MTPLAWFGLGVVVFVAAAAYDWANSNYIKANADDLAARAAGWSALTSAIGLIGLLGILEISPWLAAPEVAGFSLGTYVAIWMRRRRR